jgi:hypothetical protein
MSLLTRGIGFRQPSFDLGINVRYYAESKMVDMVSRCDFPKESAQ